MDATIAVSEGGANKLMQALLSTAQYSKSASGSWGPFTVGYSVSVALSGGRVELIDFPIEVVRLHDVNVAGTVGVSFTFDLGNILPEICIPPVQVCISIPLIGEVCTPQFCVPWPSVTVPITLPFSFNVSADFGLRVNDGGTTWDIALLVYPFSFVIDFSPMIDLVLNAIRQTVDNVLNAIPLIGNLIAHLLDLVIGALRSVLDAIFRAIDALIHEVVLLLDVFSPTIPVKLISLSKVQVFLPASGPGDPDVDMALTALDAYIEQHELIGETAFA